MERKFYKLFVLALLITVIACNSDEQIDGYKSNEILIVTLDIEDKIDIEKIILTSTYEQSADSILKNEIGNQTTFKLKCPQKGEGTFTICIYTNNDTLCSQESYIEGGYRPKMKFENNKFEITDWY